MLATALIAVMSMQMVQCVEVPAGKTPADIEARGEPWFVQGAPMLLGKRRYVQSGPARGMSPAEVAPFARHGGATVFARTGDAGRDLVYVLADIRDCTFQVYRAQADRAK
jgi:hypothetical protein